MRINNNVGISVARKIILSNKKGLIKISKMAKVGGKMKINVLKCSLYLRLAECGRQNLTRWRRLGDSSSK